MRHYWHIVYVSYFSQKISCAKHHEAQKRYRAIAQGKNNTFHPALPQPNASLAQCRWKRCYPWLGFGRTARGKMRLWLKQAMWELSGLRCGEVEPGKGYRWYFFLGREWALSFCRSGYYGLSSDQILFRLACLLAKSRHEASFRLLGEDHRKIELKL